MLVWCIMNGWESFNLFTSACMLTNRLHGKGAELCLANSQNNSVITTKHMSTTHVRTYVFLSRGVSKVLL